MTTRLIGIAAMFVSASAAAQVTLTASSWLPPLYVVTARMLVPLCADMEKVTSGRVKCNVLAKAPVGPFQTYDALRDGLIDISFITHGYSPGRFPLAEAIEFPFMGDSAEATSVAYQRVYERMLAKANEHTGVKVLSMFTHGPGQFFNTKRAINSVSDLQGMKYRVGSASVGNILEKLGAVTLLRPASETYELLSSGIADGTVLPAESPVGFKLLTVIKYATIIPGGLYTQSFAWAVNPAKWNSIPERDRNLIEPLLGEALARRSGGAWGEMDIKGLAATREAKIPVATASPAFVAEIKARTESLERDWIEKKAKPKGIDGAAVLSALREEAAKVAAGK